jgi:hypothetical protein
MIITGLISESRPMGDNAERRTNGAGQSNKFDFGLSVC